ncbi:hypothetical protein TcasGA2_TC031587 [Tribolium castaneum]|uniref:Uncharacterized protein n=1 Tax=Tribolium castaneum TaxID=7070 RepID=A0A139WA12_TRICA|nr:hypothetical protein TcasGA2_TC031587 [Tribolium castaneum]
MGRHRYRGNVDSDDSDSSDDEPRPKRSTPGVSTTVNSPPVSAESARIARLEQLVENLNRRLLNRNFEHTSGQVGIKSDLIPEFAPGNPNFSTTKWLHKIDQLALVNGWDERTTIYGMISRLKGLAKEWYDNLDPSAYDRSWDEWKRLLQATFPDHHDYASTLRKLVNRVKEDGETWAQYYFGKLNLLQACDITGTNAVSCLIDGITDVTLRNGARAGRYVTPESLYAEYLSTLRSEGDKRDTLAKQAPRERRRFLPSRVEAQKLYSSVRCYNCRNRGHVATKCPKPRIECKKCGRIGHVDAECRRGNVVKENMSKQALTTSVADASNNKNYYIDIKVNGKPTRAYIDSGAEPVLVKQSVARELGLMWQPSLHLIRGYGQGITKVHGEVEVELEVDLVKANVKALIVEDSAQRVPVIVGQTFLNAGANTIIANEEAVRVVDGNNESIQAFLGQLPTRKVALWAEEETVIPPQSIGCIRIKAKDDGWKGAYYVEWCQRPRPGFEHVVHRCVTCDGGLVTVRNLSHQDLVYRKAQIVARAEPCEQERTATTVSVFSVGKVEVKSFQRWELLTQVNKNLDPAQFEQLLQLVNEFRDCFARNVAEIGATTAAEMKLTLTDDKPVIYRPYRLSHHERRIVRDIVNDLLGSGVIRESDSPYSSPILLVRKKDGQHRMCVDYRQLNSKTIKDRFPLPRVDEHLDKLKGAKFFTTLDLASGYFQIPMATESIPKTAFVTPDGHCEFVRMPFGLANAPAVFQRAMNKVLGPLQFQTAFCYIDDLLIPSKDFETGLNNLQTVFQLLRQFGLTLKLSKYCFFGSQIEYLGHEISAEGIKPGETKIKAVTAFPKPTDVHKLRQFLGLCGYFRKYVKDYATIANSLTSLLKNGSAFVLEEVQERAFQTLKDILTSRPVLAIYDAEAETELHTDASKVGIGGILLQRQGDGSLRPVMFFSRQTTKEEQRYHSYELETLAVVCSLKHYRVYLLGLQFKVITDCNALRTTLTKRDLIPRIGRWWLLTSEFDFTVEYRPGSKMSHVDALSRNTVLDPSEPSVEVLHINVNDDDWILAVQMKDARCALLKEILEKSPTNAEERAIHKEYKLKDGRVFKQTESGLKWVVPKAVRRQILLAHHDGIGHLSNEKTLASVSKSYWFPSMRSKKFKTHCTDLNVKLVLTATATPRANGQVERLNRTILSQLAASSREEEKWDDFVSRISWGINSTPNSTTGKSPYELLLGYTPRHANDSILTNVVTEGVHDGDLPRTRADVAQRVEKEQQKQKERYDKRRCAPKRFNAGDLVLVRTTRVSNEGKSRKLLPKYSGPYRIQQVLDYDRYVVTDMPGATRSQKRYEGVHSVDKLRHYVVATTSGDETIGDELRNHTLSIFIWVWLKRREKFSGEIFAMGRHRYRGNVDSDDSDSSDDEPRPKRSAPGVSTTVNSPPVSAESARIARLEQLVENLNRRLLNRNFEHTSGQVGIKSDLIPEFAPGNPNFSTTKWLHKIDQLALVNGWDERTTIYGMISRLKGLAKEWYDNLDPSAYDRSWDEWKRLLQATFPDHHDYASTLLSCLIDGMTDVTLRNGARAGRYVTPESLYAEYLSTLRSEGDKRDTLAKQAPRERRRFLPSRVEAQKLYSSVRCYNCRNRGHVATKCPKPRIECKKCGRIGHVDAECRRGNVVKENMSKQALTTSVADASNNKNYYIDIKVNGKPTRAYIDSGAEPVLVKQSVARELGLMWQPSLHLIRGYGQGITKVHGEVEVELEVDLVKANVKALIVEDSAQRVPVIVGQTFLNAGANTIIANEEAVRVVDGNNESIQAFLGQLPTRKVALWAEEETVIPPQSIGCIRIKAKDDGWKGAYYVEGCQRPRPGFEHVVHRCVTCDGGLVTVRNLSHQDLVYRKAQIVARAEPCEQERTATTVSVFSVGKVEVKSFQRWELLTQVNKNLDPAQFEQLLQLVNEFRDCFARNVAEIGATTVAEMKLTLTDDKPVIYRPYRLSHHERRIVRDIVNDLLGSGVIRESDSPYSSPILLVRKKDGQHRMCVDYRQLNSKTIKDRFPLPRVDEHLDKLNGAKFFTTLDLASGYYQIPMATESIPKTAFVTPDGHYEFVRMPFGLANAPAVFQRAMNKVLGPLRFQTAFCYIDDLLIPSKDFETGLNNLRTVFQLLRQFGLTLKLSKCCFFGSQIEYLGHEISAEGIKPGETKIKAVTAFPKPTDVHKLRQFLGLCGYFRKYVKDYATIANSLTSLLKKGSAFVWEEAQERAFQTLKDILTSRPVLAIYDAEAETELHTDASKVGIGGILLQRQGDGSLRPVMFFSRQTTKEEQRYHSYELETLAVVCSLKHYRVYLLGLQFKVITDCNALRTTLTKRDLIPRIGRWWLLTSEFDFTVEYRPGSKMSHVDALSRNPVLDPSEPSVEVLHINVNDDDWILAVQMKDARCALLKEILEKSPTNAEERAIHKEYKLKDGRVFKQTESGLKWVVPKAVRRQILLAHHDGIGHLSNEKTLASVSKSYWFPSMRSKKFKTHCTDLNVKLVLTATATPRANGQVERLNRTILSQLAASSREEEKWDDFVSRISWGINSTPNSTTGKSPYELLLGYTPRHANDSILTNVVTEGVHDGDLPRTRADVAQRVEKEQQKQKERYDKRRCAPKRFNAGDLVLVRTTRASNEGKSRKLLPKYSGPYRIQKVLDYDRYRGNVDSDDSDSSDDEPRPKRSAPGVSTTVNSPPVSAESARIARLEQLVENLNRRLLNRNFEHTSGQVGIKSDLIPEFAPGNPNFSTTKWLHKIDQLALVNGWDERTTIYGMISRLKGLAKEWYDNLDPSAYDRSWDEWKLSCLIDGMTDVTLRNGARAGRYVTPESLYAEYLSTLRSEGDKRDTLAKQAPRERRRFLPSRVETQKLYSARNQELSARNVVALDMWMLSRRGNLVKENMSKQALTTSVADASNNKNYYIDIKVNGKPTRAYIDSGAEPVLVKQSVARELGLMWQPSLHLIRGYGQGITKVHGEVEVELEVDLVKANVKALIVEDSAQRVPVIVGQTFLNAGANTIIANEEAVRVVDGNNESIQAFLGQLPTRKVALWAEEETVIPPQSIGCIRIKAKDDGKKFKTHCTDLNVKLVLTATATPRANGQVERLNRTILSQLAASSREEEKWDDFVSRISWGINSTPNSTTGKSPYELLLGYTPRHANDSILTNVVTEGVHDGDLPRTRADVAQRVEKEQQKQKERYDKRRCAPKRFNAGDLVLVRTTRASNEGKSRKLLPKYSGPYRIQKVLDYDRYVVTDMPGATRSQKRYEGVHSVDKLRHYVVATTSGDETIGDELRNHTLSIFIWVWLKRREKFSGEIFAMGRHRYRGNVDSDDSDSSDDEPRPKRSAPGVSTTVNSPPVSAESARIARLEQLVENLNRRLLNRNFEHTSGQVGIKSGLIPEFAPGNPNFSTTKWLHKIDQLALVNGWDERTTIYGMISRLKGLAKEWYDNLDPSAYDRSWDEWKRLLQATFPDHHDYASTLRKLVNRVKEDGETWAQYYFGKLNLLQACDITGTNAVSCLIDGITDVTLRNGARAGRYVTPESLYAEYLSTLRSEGDKRDTLAKQAPRERRRFLPSRVEAQKLYSSVRCYNCRNRGHVATKCPKPRIECKKCGRIGHVDAECRRGNVVKENMSKQALTTSVADASNNKNYYIDIKVNGKPTRAYIDSGAEPVLVKQSVARELGLMWQPSLHLIRGYGQGITKVHGEVEVELEVDLVKANVKALIVEDSAQRVPVIVGQTFLNAGANTIIANEEAVRVVDGNNESIQAFLGQLPTRKVALWAEDETVIPPQSIGCIRIKAKDDGWKGAYYVEGCQRPRPGFEHVVHRCVTCDGGLVTVRNLSHQDLVYRKAQIVARAEPCEQEWTATTLAASSREEEKWDDFVSRISWGINSTPNSTTGKSPYELLLGYTPRHANDSILTNVVTEGVHDGDLPRTRADVAQRVEKEQQKQKERYDKRRCAPKRFNAGDLVLVRTTRASNEGKSRKLLPKYSGPYRIQKVLDYDRYVVTDMPGATRSQKRYEGVHSVDKLRHYVVATTSGDETIGDVSDE